VESVPLSTHPTLDPVFGPLVAADDREVRAILAAVDRSLLDLASFFGVGGAGYGGTGLDLCTYPCSEAKLQGYVTACRDRERQQCVSFIASLRPIDLAAWEAECEIYADCQHSTYHGHDELVHALPVRRATSAAEAASALQLSVEALVALARNTPLDKWLELASDAAS